MAIQRRDSEREEKYCFSDRFTFGLLPNEYKHYTEYTEYMAQTVTQFKRAIQN